MCGTVHSRISGNLKNGFLVELFLTRGLVVYLVYREKPQQQSYIFDSCLRRRFFLYVLTPAPVPFNKDVFVRKQLFRPLTEILFCLNFSWLTPKYYLVGFSVKHSVLH